MSTAKALHKSAKVAFRDTKAFVSELERALTVSLLLVDLSPEPQ